MMSPWAVLTLYKYLYFFCLASSFVSGSLLFAARPRCAALGSPGAPTPRKFGCWAMPLRSAAINGWCWKCGFLWSTCQAVMKLWMRMPTIMMTGHMKMTMPPQQGGGAGFGWIVMSWTGRSSGLVRLEKRRGRPSHPFQCNQVVHEEINGQDEHTGSEYAARHDHHKLRTAEGEHREYHRSPANRDENLFFAELVVRQHYDAKDHDDCRDDRTGKAAHKCTGDGMRRAQDGAQKTGYHGNC